MTSVMKPGAWLSVNTAASVAITTLTLVGCARPVPTIVIDNYHNVPWAVDSCKSAEANLARDRSLIDQLGCAAVTICPAETKIHDACRFSSENSGGVYEYVSDLETAFATAPECAGVKVAVHGNSLDSSKELRAVARSAYWEFTIDFIPGETEQEWGILHPSTFHVSFGRGNVNQTAKAACLIAKEAGARVTG